ncbi:MAG: YceI family protein [Solirubrobacterales bacterium]
MSTTTTIDRLLAAGTYNIDVTHSNARFEVEHAGISIFRGGFKPIDAKLVSGEAGLELDGTVRVETIDIDDENIRPHLLSPEFFDAERNPDIRFRSTEITGSADQLTVTGVLEMAGASKPVQARGRLRGPVPGPGGGEKASFYLETVVDRTEYGMDWQMDIPGGGVALANEVKLLVELELNRE